VIVIGELINSTRKNVRPAIEQRDTAAIQKMAKDQAEAGAHFIDVNSGHFIEGEPELLQWLVQTVQAAVDLPCALDSPRTSAIEAGLEVHRGQAMINSITGESERMQALLPIIAKAKPKVVALCMDDTGIPNSTQARVAIACKLIDALAGVGVPNSDVFVDPCVLPVSSADLEGKAEHPGEIVVNVMRALKAQYPEVHLSGGLSNVSYGLPKRKLINRAACLVYMAAGMDAAIIDPLDEYLMSLVHAAECILNRDEMCMGYITADREGKLVV